MEPAATVHSGDYCIDCDVSPRVLDTFVFWIIGLFHEEVFEPLNFFGFTEGDSEFFYRKDVSFAIVMVFFDEGGQ